jgi:hypothetical protein
MSDTDNIDILNDLENTDLSDVSTDRQLLPKGTFEFVVQSVKIEPNSKNTGMLVNIVLATTQEYESEPDNSGQTHIMPAGSVVFDTISLVQTEKWTKDKILAMCKSFREAVTGDGSGPFSPPEQYEGEYVMANIKIERSEEYGDRNRVARYIKQG